MDDTLRNELLHAAARRQVFYGITGSGQVVSQYHHRHVTDEATELIEAGLLRKLDRFRFLVPTEAAREVYVGDDKCPTCGAFESTQWQGEGRSDHRWNCPNCGTTWRTPIRPA